MNRNAGQPPGKADNSILGRYSSIESLGDGAFGTIIKCFDTRLKRTVAIKVLKRETAVAYPERIREIEERFSREAEAAARTGVNPNIVSVFDLVTDDTHTMYLILQYVEGGDLAARIRKGPIPLALALRWTADAAAGLQVAHDAGIIHRDVKPANIFITSDERALIGDFGVAQIDTLSHRTTTLVHHPGTPLYMSPEQTETTGYLRPSSDQYSLGTVLFELLVGKPYKRYEPDRAITLLASQPAPVRSLIGRMVEAEPRNRYPSMADVVAAIRAIERRLDNLSAQETIVPPQPDSPASPALAAIPEAIPATIVSGEPSGPLPPDARRVAPSRIHRRALLVAIGGVIASSASGGFLLAEQRRGGQGSDAATLPPAPTTGALGAAPATPTVATATVVAVVPTAAAITPAPSPTPTGIATALYPPLQQHQESVLSVAFSADRQSFATGSQDELAVIWRVRDGKPLHDHLQPGGVIHGVAFSPDGNFIATGASDRRVNFFSTVNGQVSRPGPLLGHTDAVTGVAYSPDGRVLASSSFDKSVRLWNISDGTFVGPLPHNDRVLCVAFSADGQMIATGSADTQIRLWRVGDRSLIKTLRGHADNVNGVAFSVDGKMLASASSDMTAQIWRVDDGTSVHGGLRHKGVVYGVAFAPSGQFIATASDETTAVLLSVSNGGRLGPITPGHTAGLRSVAITSDGKTLATASVDKTVQVYRLRDGIGQ